MAATAQDISVARIVAATELAKVATTQATALADKEPKAIGEAYKTIFKAIAEAS